MSARLLVDDELRTHMDILPIDVLTREILPEVRKIGEANVTGMSPAADDSVLERRQKPVEEHEIELFIYRSSSTPSNNPAILWIHGGGYVMKDSSMIRMPALTDCLAMGVKHLTVAFVDIPVGAAGSCSKNPASFGHSDRSFGDNSLFFGEWRYFCVWTGSRGPSNGRHVVIGTHGSHDEYRCERP